VPLGHVDVGVERAQVGQLVHLGAVAHGGADIEETPQDDAGKGRADDRARQLQLGQVETMLGILGVAAGLLVLVLADQPSIQQVLQPLHLSRAGLERRPRPCSPDPLLVILEKGQSLAGLDRIALLHREALDHAPRAGDDRSPPVGSQSGAGRVEGRDRLARRRGHQDGDGVPALRPPGPAVAPPATRTRASAGRRVVPPTAAAPRRTNDRKRGQHEAATARRPPAGRPAGHTLH